MSFKSIIKGAYTHLLEILSPKLIKHPKNMNHHSPEQIERLAKLIEFQGQRWPVIISNLSGYIVAGHGRLEAMKLLHREKSWDMIWVDYQDFDNEAQEYAFMVSDNAIQEWAELDLGMINTEMLDLGPDFDIEMLGLKDFEIEPIEKFDPYSDGESGSMSKNFIAPPFSVLDTKQEYWLSRRRAWMSIGIKSEEGRKQGMLDSEALVSTLNGGTSVFDPVLAEIAYTWFCPVNGLIVDCFSGGSVRGIVASHTGRQYIGVDIREEQVEANRLQESIAVDPIPVWKCGDSAEIDVLLSDIKADMIFSCPPYADLEVYSDNPKDISNMEYEDFKKVYFDIVKKSCSLLKDDSFACFVVGEVRDKKGVYYNFVSDTINAFKEAGLSYYNEIVLVNSAGTLPLRAGRAFKASRKIGKMHQNVLVFVKGDAKKAVLRCGNIEVMENESDEI